MKNDTGPGRRTTMIIPDFIDKSVQLFKERSGSPSWNAALWEIVREGLIVKFEKQEQLERNLSEYENSIRKDS
ncbi:MULTISPECIES: hypothetical protein [Paenibacillus]|uniref:hypothetical protein n=1 Tax=Paenibacillus TaxID=44249 RepID=UPI00040A46B2|nr:MULTISPECIES: hypothetical protein [Paenibacillus]KGP78120.1 hypothetical protein P364_0130160 [Paenibacillus sp. MAEPY2]KGP89358.1 hypothetical protein P363_0101490 [Paenibacillus sp. MAEPY1]OZQ71092.1 hypothetical protein CA599_11195 [Paenibacillus taichungensis]